MGKLGGRELGFGSDLDIICHVEHGMNFQQAITDAYGYQAGFRIKQTIHNDLPTVVANFEPEVTVDEGVWLAADAGVDADAATSATVVMLIWVGPPRAVPGRESV